ncbi:MAG: cytochrome c3 family protein [Nitrospiria bacterium]
MNRPASAIIRAIVLLLWVFPAMGQIAAPPPVPKHEDITNTRHNLSVNPPDVTQHPQIFPKGTPGQDPRRVFTSQTSEICIFCHTPHGANEAAASAIQAPIWNRQLSSAQYTLYDQVWSKSFDGQLNLGAPTGYSRLCLSCHDGTVALGAVINKPGSGGYTNPLSSNFSNNSFTMNYQGGDVYQSGPQQDPTLCGFLPNTMPTGGAQNGGCGKSGDTRRLGTNLTNTHPISFLFDSALAAKDTELVDPGVPLQRGPGVVVTDHTPISPAARYPGNNINIYDSVQCTSCHNPHQVDYPKFLRASIFSNAPEHPGEQIICLYCHNKPGWIGSTHQVSQALHNEYPTASNPYDYDGAHSVDQFACRNCHDPHTVQGAKRIHREGVDQFGLDATEKTCFLCHSPNTAPASGGQGNAYNNYPLSTLIAGDPTSQSNPRFITGKPAPDINSQFSKDINLTPNAINCYTSWQPQVNATGPGNFPECGSAMDITNLGHGGKHEPVFVSRPQEGVELGSPAPPANNEFPPGLSNPDQVPHVTCTDCHNPHQVVPGNRLKGMKGIDINGLVVGHGVPGNDRDPFVYEVCFRCHGNSYTKIFSGDRFPDDTITRSDPRDFRPLNADFSMRGFSNKRKEFSPNTPDTLPDHSQQFVNSSFHPVAAAGRNGTSQICKQLAEAFHLNCANPAAALQNVTIQCTDCHNSEATNVVKGPVTESNLRATDTLSAFTPLKTLVGPGSPPAYEPVGPHGSRFIRILRNRYNTDIQNPARCFEGSDVNQLPNPAGCGTSDGNLVTGQDLANRKHFDNFLLCFQCHDRRAFDPTEPGANRTDNTWTNFFGDISAPDAQWNGNLHMYHLQWTGAMCHECHYNVHSNVEAQNTQFGDGRGSRADLNISLCTGASSGVTYPCLPPDGQDGIIDGVVDTHLINFSPKVEGTIATKPRWAYDAVNKQFQCFLRCHNEIMNSCHYGRSNGGNQLWCAGGAVRG